MSGLTSRQADVLGIAGANGPLTARDIGEYHLPGDAPAARSALAALERKGIVAANYTCRAAIDQRARAYTITQGDSDSLASALRDFAHSDDFPRPRDPGRRASQRGGAARTMARGPARRGGRAAAIRISKPTTSAYA